MSTSQHHRAFVVSVGWTLLLLFLGSVVHATGSSLACPDWPTCHGTMVPPMEGGVFWEHLHRLVAGGLILMWLLAGWLIRNERAPAAIRRAWAVGLGLLVVQAVFGGVTVLLRLPAAVSTTHLGLAFLFLALATALSEATSPVRARSEVPAATARTLRVWAPRTAGLIFMQSLLGGLVRHTEAGMACPDVPLCLGRMLPPLDQPAVAVHYAHRVVAVVAATLVIGVALAILRGVAHGRVRSLALGAAALVVAQVALGVLSVASRLAVAPVSLHTVVAAALFACWVALTAHGYGAPRAAAPRAERMAVG